MERVPSMFVLLGSFQSYACNSASTDYAAVKDNFRALADLLAGFSRIKVPPPSGCSFSTHTVHGSLW
jgi:hypothetical protein